MPWWPTSSKRFTKPSRISTKQPPTTTVQTAPADTASGSPETGDPDVRRFADELGERLGARVQVLQGGGGKGRLVIHYASLDQLDGILERIKERRGIRAGRH